jgi:hypothetical protein
MPDERGTCPPSGVSHRRIGEAIVNDAGHLIAVMTILDQHDDGGRGAAVTGLCWWRYLAIVTV